MKRPLCTQCKERECEAYKTKKGITLFRKLCWKCRSLENPNYEGHYARYQLKLRKAVIDHYGGECKCCGEKRFKFLTIDHVNNDGHEHRKEVPAGTPMLRWLKKNNFPKDFQILCFNCNCGRALNGGVCPHKDGDMVQ